MSKTTILVISLLLIVASFVFGIFWGERMNKISAEAKQLDQLVGSSILRSFTLVTSGSVAAVENRTLTVNQGGASFSIVVDEDVKVSLITVSQDNGNFSQVSEDATFDSIEIGDTVTIVSTAFADENFILSAQIVTKVVNQQ